MKAGDQQFRTIWIDNDEPDWVKIIDQTLLPFHFQIQRIGSVGQMADAIKNMQVRGAGLIGASAAYGMYLSARSSNIFPDDVESAARLLMSTRPTAVNLQWAVTEQLKAMQGLVRREDIIQASREMADQIADSDSEACRQIGLHGVKLIQTLASRKKGPIQILTHCNAGWLAFVDYGSATAPIYEAHKRGIEIHVWVDETRPRNQGSLLTAWELQQEGIPHTVICDNTGGHLMQNGLVDLVITGTDRTTRHGDVANKIGTYLKALAAWDNGIPFYVALPSSSFDWQLRDGKHIPIEKRNAREVKYIAGQSGGESVETLICNPESPAENYGFDITPARLISGLITERGICAADELSILKLFPEHENDMTKL